MNVLNLELALVTKLKALKVACSPFEGLTTQAERREKVRAAVRQVADVTYTVRDGRRLTMADAFLMAYGTKL